MFRRALGQAGHFLGDGFGYFGGVTASINLWTGPSDPPFLIGVNLVALAALIALTILPSPHSATPERAQ